ncbi:hypothetical protein EWM64_g9967 [Hericium alpestre]|uniref:Uncharacterized protein n=1 Tax=Hericium alpestre TaxID=135208 RepID=A0A4Y9ZH30_9AGAM|nr:hypothetical protein EWM64_g9967 [Hericium alpestre]
MPSSSCTHKHCTLALTQSTLITHCAVTPLLLPFRDLHLEQGIVGIDPQEILIFT